MNKLGLNRTLLVSMNENIEVAFDELVNKQNRYTINQLRQYRIELSAADSNVEIGRLEKSIEDLEAHKDNLDNIVDKFYKIQEKNKDATLKDANDILEMYGTDVGGIVMKSLIRLAKPIPQ